MSARLLLRTAAYLPVWVNVEEEVEEEGLPCTCILSRHATRANSLSYIYNPSPRPSMFSFWQ